VGVQHTKPRNNEETDGKKKAALGISDLPGTIRGSFTKQFMPLYIEYLGKSKDPWSATPKARKLVQFMGELYPTLQVDIQEDPSNVIWVVVSVYLV
jgi:hypothetical protein